MRRALSRFSDLESRLAPDWDTSASSLHENTKVALQQSDGAGEHESRNEFPPELLLTDNTKLCGEASRSFRALRRISQAPKR